MENNRKKLVEGIEPNDSILGFIDRTTEEVEKWPDWKKEGWDMIQSTTSKKAVDPEDSPEKLDC
jgi:hypothetical protein